MQEMLRDVGSIPGLRRPLEESVAMNSSYSAREIPWTEEPGGLWSIGLPKVGHNWSDLTCIQNKSQPDFLEQIQMEWDWFHGLVLNSRLFPLQPISRNDNYFASSKNLYSVWS